jgi:hypothetical protein
MEQAISHTGEYRSSEDIFVLFPLNPFGFPLYSYVLLAGGVFSIDLERVICVCVLVEGVVRTCVRVTPLEINRST